MLTTLSAKVVDEHQLRKLVALGSLRPVSTALSMPAQATGHCEDWLLITDGKPKTQVENAKRRLSG